MFFLAALGLCRRVRLFSSCGEQRPLSRCVRGLLIAVASLLQSTALGPCKMGLMKPMLSPPLVVVEKPQRVMGKCLETL